MPTIVPNSFISSPQTARVLLDKPEALEKKAAEARGLLIDIRAKITTAGGTVQTGYLSLQRADTGKVSIENRSRLNPFGSKDEAAEVVKDLIRIAYGDRIGIESAGKLEAAMDTYLADKSFGKKLGTVSFVKLLNKLEAEVHNETAPPPDKKSSFQSLLGAGGSLAIDGDSIAKGAQKIEDVRVKVKVLKNDTANLAFNALPAGIDGALKLLERHDNLVADIKKDHPENQTLQAWAGTLEQAHEALTDKLNSHILAQVDTLRPPGKASGLSTVATLQDQIKGLEALQRSLPPQGPGPITEDTHSGVMIALTQARIELGFAESMANLADATRPLLQEGTDTADQIEGATTQFGAHTELAKALTTNAEKLMHTGLHQSITQLDDQKTALAVKLNADISARVDTIRPSDQEGAASAVSTKGAVAALQDQVQRLQDQVQRLQALHSQLPQGPDSPILPATQSKVDAALSQAQEALNAEVLKLLQALQPHDLTAASATHAVAVMQSYVADLAALQAQLQPAQQARQISPIDAETRRAVEQALAQATSKLDQLNETLRLQSEGLAARSKGAIDVAQQYLAQGGGLTALTALDMPGAVAALVAIDALLGSTDSATATSRQALQNKRDELAKAIAAAVEPHVDPASPAALQLKVQQIASLGLQETRALLDISFAPILLTFATDVGNALIASAGQTPGRVDEGIAGLRTAFADSGLDGLSTALGNGLGKAKALAELARDVQDAVAASNFTEAFTAMDAFVAAADPSLQDDLNMITANLIGELREAVDSVPGKLSQEAQAKLLVGAYHALAAMEQALPAEGPEDITALRGQVTTARLQALNNTSAGFIRAARDKELTTASEIPDLGRKAAALNGILARAVVLTGEDGPEATSGNAYAERVRDLAVAALGAQRAALETSLTAAGSTAPARGERSAERAAVTAELRSFIRNLDALESAAPGPDVIAMRATVAPLQLMDVRNQLGPKARQVVDPLLSPSAPASDDPEDLAKHQENLTVTKRLVEIYTDQQTKVVDPLWLRRLGESHSNVGRALAAQGNLEAALVSHKQALAIREQLVASDPQHAGRQQDLSASHASVGDVLKAQGNLEAALVSHEQALATRGQLAAQEPADQAPHPIQAALLRLYEARVLTLPSFTDRLEFLADRRDPADLFINLANGDATEINGHFSGPEWGATALRMKLLAVNTGVTTESVLLEDSLKVAKENLNIALRVGNPDWHAKERTKQLRDNPLGPNAGGMLNIKFDKESVEAFLKAGKALEPGAAREAGPPGKPLDVNAFKLTLARVVHLEGMQPGGQQAQTLPLVRQILSLPEDMSDADVLASTQAGESFSSPEAALKMADELGEFAERIANNPRVVTALAQFSQDAGDARPDAALLVDRISAHTLRRSQEAGGGNFGLRAVERLYGRAWTTTLGQVPQARRDELGKSALLVQSLVSNQPSLDTDFLNNTAARLADKPSLEQGAGGEKGANLFSHYFGVGSKAFRERVDLDKLKPEAVRALQTYTAKPITVAPDGQPLALRDQVDRLVATLDEDGFAQRADALIQALPEGEPTKAHFTRLIKDLSATVTDAAGFNNDRGNVAKARGRLEALCDLAGRSQVIGQIANTRLAAAKSQSMFGRLMNVANSSTPATIQGFPPAPAKADDYRRWAVSELGIVNRSSPDLMRIATGVMLEQFASSSYPDFGAFQQALVGGEGIASEVTAGLIRNLEQRLQEVGLGNVSAATGAMAGDNQVVSLLRLSLFAYPTAEGFMAQVAKGLPETGESAQEATGALKEHLETYSNAGAMMLQQVRSLMPGQTLEIQLTTTGGVRIKAPVAAPGVSATAGFSASRDNSLSVTREGDGYVVVCKTAVSGGLSAGISALAGRASASASAGGEVAAGQVLTFTEARMGDAGALRQPVERVGELLASIFSTSDPRARSAVLRDVIPDQMHLLDGHGAYVGAEAGANANAKLPGPLAAVSLTLEVGAAVGAQTSVTNVANAFEHRRTAQTSFSLAAQASAAIGTQETQAAASVSTSITMKKEKTMVTTHGVVTNASFTRTTAAIENALNGGSSNGDFERMLTAIGVPDEVRGRFQSQLSLMQRQGPTSVALRQQLAPEAALRLATLGPNESPGEIINDPANYELTALEFTVAGQASSTTPAAAPENEADSDPNDLVASSQDRVDAAQEDLEVARAVLADPQAALDDAVGAQLAQVDAARDQLGDSLGQIEAIGGPAVAAAAQSVAGLADRAGSLAASLSATTRAQGSAILGQAESVGALELAQDGTALLAAGLEGAADVLGEVTGMGLSVSFERTGTASSTRVFTLELA